MKKAVFLDRDGVINKAKIINGKPYPPKSKSDVEIFTDVVPSVNKLKDKGFEIIVITNQPDIARNKTDLKTVLEIQEYIRNKVNINNFYLCPHDDIDKCECRKPKIGLLVQAAEQLNIDLNKSYVVGDRWRDIQAGQDAGCSCFFINHKYSEKYPILPFIEVKSLSDATDIIIGETL
jgi:D-glycero-D-manno-heptose 1,7-bisphosphate phosphatase